VVKNAPVEWIALHQDVLYPIRALKVVEEPVRKGTVVTLKVNGMMNKGEIFQEPVFKRKYRVINHKGMDEKGTTYVFKRVDGGSIISQDIALLKAGTTIKVVSRLPISKIIPTFT
jgi:hypothetical protein